MAGYEDTKQKIIQALTGRPIGTEILPERHQDYALNMLDYIRSVELIQTSNLIGLADPNTTPVQPTGKVCYIAGVDQNKTVTFANFIASNGHPITITTGEMEGAFITLLWDTQFWSVQKCSTSIISRTDSASYYYRYNIRKTYASIAAMNADKAAPIATDGKNINIGDIVTVVNSTTPAENGIYSYEGATDGWKYQSSFNFQLSQTTGTDPNVAMSQKIVTENFNKLWTVLNALTIPNYYIVTNGDTVTSDGTFTYPFKISENINLSMFDKFIISEVLQRTDLAYMAVYDKDKVCLHAYIYETGMTTQNLVVNVSDILASYPTAVYIRFCSNDTTAIVTSYCNQAYLLTNRITAIELQQSTYPFVFNLKPDNIQKYWSAGGVLSYHANYVSKSIDVTRFAGKRLRVRLGFGGSQSTYVSYCFVKKSDDSYVSLASIVKSYDSVSKIVDVILPSNAVSLDVSISILTLDLQPFVCYDSIYNQLNDSYYLKQSDYDMSFSGMKYSLLKKENGYIALSTGLKPNTADTNWMGNAGYIGVTEGTVISYRLNALTNVAALAAYDSNKNYLSANTIPGNGVISGTYTVPAGVAFVRVTSEGGSDQTNVVLNFDRPVLIEGLYSLYTINSILSDNLNRITAIEDNSFAYILNKNILKDVSVNYGYQNPNGGITGLGADTNRFNTDFIKVKPNSDIIVTSLGGQGTAVMTVGFFDSSYVCLKDISIAEYISGTRTINVSDSRIKYVRFSGSWPNYANGTAVVKMYTPVTLQSVADITMENSTTIEENTNRITAIEEELKNVPIGYRYDINHFIHYGQSLSQGDWETHIVSDVQKYNSLMFTGTPRVWEYRDQAHKYDALIPAVEEVFIYRNEVDTLNITNGASSNGNINITLAGTTFPVAVLSTDNTPNLVAAKVRANAFAGWTVSGTDSTVIFTKNATGVCTAPVFDPGTTGVYGSIGVTVAGENVVGAVYRGETPCVGTAEKLMQLITDEDNFDYNVYGWQMLVSAPGMGGTSIDELSNKNDAYYQRLLADVTNGKRLSNLQGKSFACNAVSWIQGEADSYWGMAEDVYYGKMVSLFDNLNTDIKAITGQSTDVHFFLYQTDSCHFYGGYHYPYISLAQLKIALNKRNVHLVTPIYFLPKIGDNTHFSAMGSKWFGGYFGIAYKRVIIEGKDFKPIYLKDYFVQGNNIYITLNVPKPPLVIDTINQVDRGVGKGFQIRNVDDTANNSYLDIITGVEIIRPDMIKITCSESPAGKKLTYAVSNANSYGVSSAFVGGNIRDSQSIVFNFKNSIGDLNETEHKMYNWTPIFEQIL